MYRILTAPEVTGDDVNNIAATIKGMNLLDVAKFVVLVIVVIILVKLLTALLDKVVARSKIDKSAHSFLHLSLIHI